MQAILRDSERVHPSPANSAKARKGVMIVCVLVLVGYLAMVQLPDGGDPIVAEPLTAKPMAPRTPRDDSTEPRRVPRRVQPVEAPPQPVGADEANVGAGDGSVGVPSSVEREPWGYNKDRNVPRFKGILKELKTDQARDPSRRFTVVDYGSDQGFFSIGIANAFAGKALVMGLEMGGVGGSIWVDNKGNKVPMDVLDIQEKKIREYNVEKNVVICQGLAHQDQFDKLIGKHSVSDYQLVLSVFHWFKLPDRPSFEVAISNLFRNARTTFIELPTLGDNGSLIRKQVGWKNFNAWYDGRTDIAQILEDSARAQGIDIRVKLVVKVPWVRWHREVFRVDFLGAEATTKFRCDDRQEVYACKQRPRYATCPDAWRDQ